MHLRAVAARVLVPDDQVRRQPLAPPVGVRLHGLADQLNLAQVGDADQHDGQVAADAVGPQVVLLARVAGDGLPLRPPLGRGVDHAAGEAAERLGVLLRHAELPQHDVRVCERQIAHAVVEPAVAVFLDQPVRLLVGLGHAGHDVDHAVLPRLQPHAAADADHRVQHAAVRIAQPRVVHRNRVRQRPPAPGEGVAVGLVLHVAQVLALHGHQVDHQRRAVVLRPRPTLGDDRLPTADQAGLHEQVLETPGAPRPP